MANLPLYNKLYIFIKILYLSCRNIPKEYKYSLGRETITLAWQCIDLFCEANSLPNRDKYSAIRKLSAEFDKVKFRLRMMHEIDIISLNQFAYWQENYIQPIGTMIGGWQKWSSVKAGV